ncbi:hypothetical protein IQ260_02420 [Leptolyngbya cf. ectocarpi LEGE 11479]|uniref:Tetratricopeptide repeat protein n=1 Tax=Leptolyngbya cf. ectocarpi LEGE 11479 TaxID=1828722 RepID=A0A928ZQK5_LEPEC|nr:hypothetical protein [Leptolyngbya ectocarpi]MBE9065503.1 hypothetical protein [Leptolyngbya cf. ectocarpi LEGE 11479]
MQILNALQWFNRVRLTGLIGFLILLLSLRYEWYHLPPESLKVLQITTFSFGRVFSGGVILVLGIGWIRWQGGALRFTVWLALGLTLLFPYGLMTWRPQQAFLALSYWHQLSQVDIQVETSFAEVQNHWKQFISLAQFQPLPTLATFDIPDTRFFQLSQWDHVLLDGFGYSNGFFAFIGQGWSLTITGLVIVLLAVYLRGNSRLLLLYQDLRQGLPIVVIVVGLLLIHMIGANLWERALEVAYARGDYAAVGQQSPWLMRIYPPFQGDPHGWRRYGDSLYYQGHPDVGLSAFCQGMAHYQGHRFAQAIPYLEQAWQAHPQLLVIREYLAAALINQGTAYFNAPTLPFSVHGNNYPNFSNSPLNPIAPNSQRQLNNRKSGGTSALLEQALALFPGHIQALYDLMLVKAVDQQYEASAAIATTILHEQQYFQTPNIGLMGQAHVHQTWADYHRGDLNGAWEAYRRSVNSDVWHQEPLTDE